MNVLRELIIFAGIGATMFSVAPALASWMEESEAGSYQKAKHDCDSWAFNQGSFAMQDKSYQYLAGDLIKINSGTTYNVPTAFCYHDLGAEHFLDTDTAQIIHPQTGQKK